MTKKKIKILGPSDFVMLNTGSNIIFGGSMIDSEKPIK
jgi:hypothetical protein